MFRGTCTRVENSQKVVFSSDKPVKRNKTLASTKQFLEKIHSFVNRLTFAHINPKLVKKYAEQVSRIARFLLQTSL